MMVRTECKGRKVTGLFIGARNVRKTFPKTLAAVEFELGHLRIDCELGPGFWRDQPKISDSRLCEWLEFKLYRDRRYITPLPVMLAQSGRNIFKLRPVALPSVSLAAIGDANPAEHLRRHHSSHNEGQRTQHHRANHGTTTV